MAFLLANFALAGALHFFLFVKPSASAPKSEAVKRPANKANKAVSNAFISTPKAFTFDASPDSLDNFASGPSRIRL